MVSTLLGDSSSPRAKTARCGGYVEFERGRAERGCNRDPFRCLHDLDATKMQKSGVIAVKEFFLYGYGAELDV